MSVVNGCVLDRILLAGIVSLGCVSAVVTLGTSGCTAQTVSPPKQTIRILTGAVGGGARPLMAELARQYAVTFPNIEFSLVERNRRETTIEQLERDEADLAMATADVVFRAITASRAGGSRSTAQVRAVSAMDAAALHLVVRPGAEVGRLQDLAGRPWRFALAPDSGLITELVLTAAGVPLTRSTVGIYTPMAAARKLIAGDVDAMLFPFAYPVDAIVEATKAGARLLPIEGPAIEQLLRRYGFLQLATVPAGIYPRHNTSVRTISVSVILLCRKALDEELVYQLTRQLFDILPSAAASVGGLRYSDLAHASATPIPLHEGSARYYRERQLFR